MNELKRWLKAQGAQFSQGKRHETVTLNGRRAVIPRHPAKQLPTGTVQAIKKQLGL